MSKFVNSEECVDTNLIFWEQKPTQTATIDTYEIRVFPITSILNEGTIDFSIPPQSTGQLCDLEIVTKFRIIQDDDTDLAAKTDVSVISNISNALWSLVDVKIGGRINLMQSMKNSYIIHSFISTILNTESTHSDYLFATELFLLDDAKTKSDSETTTFFKAQDSDVLLNPAASKRAERLQLSRSVTTTSKLHCPLFRTNKSLPTNMNIRISLTRNANEFLLLAASGSTYKLDIQNVFLNVKYIRPRDIVLQALEEKLKLKPATYFVQKPEVIIRNVVPAQQNISFTNIFNGKLPKYAMFMMQYAQDFAGKYDKNPLTFIPFGKMQFYIEDVPEFSSPLSIEYITKNNKNYYVENGLYLSQLYKTLGKDLRGNCMINRDNFQAHFMGAISLTPDKATTFASHLNLKETKSTRLEITWDHTTVPKNVILIVLAYYDQQIQINYERNVSIIE